MTVHPQLARLETGGVRIRPHPARPRQGSAQSAVENVAARRSDPTNGAAQRKECASAQSEALQDHGCGIGPQGLSPEDHLMGAGSGEPRQVRGLIPIHCREGNGAAWNLRLIAEQNPGLHFIVKADSPGGHRPTQPSASNRVFPLVISAPYARQRDEPCVPPDGVVPTFITGHAERESWYDGIEPPW